MTNPDDALIELERHLEIAINGFEAAIAELNKNAALIEKLQAENAALREALKPAAKVVEVWADGNRDEEMAGLIIRLNNALILARAALKGTPDDR